jgi:hypothetical protein
MRFILTILGIAIFLIVAFTALKISPDEDTPAKYAKQFLNHLQDGDYPSAVSTFGGNICRCPADLGWVSYLIYGSGEDPNLAFMMGKRFVRGGFDIKKMRSTVDKSKQTLLERPQDFEVDVPLSFDPVIYAPYFLPLDMAYGIPIKESDLNSFVADPDKDCWKALTLRMRPSLNAGTVAIPDDAKKQIDHYMKDKRAREKEEREYGEKHKNTATQTATEVAAGLAKEALAEAENSKYLIPKDAGDVLGADGKPIAKDLVASRLPRLKSALLRLHMVRRDPVEPFTVFHFVVSDPVLLLPQNGDYKILMLKNFKPPMTGVAVPDPSSQNSEAQNGGAPAAQTQQAGQTQPATRTPSTAPATSH